MTTYPSGQVTRYGRQLLEEMVDPQITVVSPGGEHIFYLSGPLAPMPGCQTGVVLSKSIRGLHPLFNHLDYRGARQDGVSWADTVYDPAEIDLDLEFTGRTSSELRQVVRDWVSSWDPRRQCTLSWWTPEFGEWWCRPRLLKAPADALVRSPGRHLRMPMSWAIRNDDAFWQSTDSISTYKLNPLVAVDNFNRTDHVSSLGSDWTVWYDTTPAHGAVGLKSGSAYWYPFGTGANRFVARHSSTSTTDFQTITVDLGGFYEFPLPANAGIDILGRMNSAGTTYVRCRVTSTSITISAIVGGDEEWSYTKALASALGWNEKITFMLGTSDGKPMQFRVLRNGFEALTTTDPGFSAIGSSNRRWGFGMKIVAASPTQKPLANITQWSAADTQQISDGNAFLSLTNRGTEKVYPKFVCYGPGLFHFGNGSGRIGLSSVVQFGPLAPGQIAVLDSNPRKRGVIDISPATPGAAPSIQSGFMQSLWSLATSGNYQLLLSAFTSLFGVIPSQGPLYSKLYGRFSRPLDGHVDGTDLVTEKVYCAITGGNADSKIIGGITPLRRWPE